MTLQRKFEILGAVLTLLLVVCLIRVWVLNREAIIRADATAKASDQIIATKDAAIKDRDAVNLQYSAALSRQQNAIQTPQQAATVILREIPAPAPVAGQPAPPPQTITTVSRADLTPAEQSKLPVSPSYGILTEDQLKQVAKQELACDATSHSLTTCSADLADVHAELTAETATAKSWEAVAKGGTKTQRFLKVLKFVGCAGAGAGAGALADKKSPAVGSAIGGAAGVAACSLF